MKAIPMQPAPARTTISKLSLFTAGVTIVLWASAFAGIRVALQSYSPYSLALLRYLTASLVLALYVAVTRAPLPDWHDLPGLAVLGFFGFSLYNIALNGGQVQISAGVASFIIASSPVYMALLSIIFFRERLTVFGWAGIGISMVGVSLITLGGAGDWTLNAYALLVLVAAASQSIYAVWMRRYIKKYGALRATTYAVWMGTVLMLIYLPGLWQDIQTATTGATAAVLYMGVFPGAIGYVCWSYVLGKVPASIAGSFLYMIPLVATFIAWLWLGEVPAAVAFVGGALIICGVVLVNKLGRSS